MASQDYVIIINDPWKCGNTSDFIDHPLPKDSVSAHGASHHTWAPGPPPSKSGAAWRYSTTILHQETQIEHLS